MSKALDTKRTYPWQTTINGREYNFRLLDRKDSNAALFFAQKLPQDDLLFLTLDITNPEELDQWIASIEANKAVSILVETNGKFVGYASLSYNQVHWMPALGRNTLAS